MKHKKTLFTFLLLCGLFVLSKPVSAAKCPLAGLHWSEGCYGCIPTLLRDFVFNRPLLSLESAIAKVTAMPAARLGETKRGRLQAGLQADIAVLNLETFCRSGQANQYAEGVCALFVDGRQVISNDRILEDS